MGTPGTAEPPEDRAAAWLREDRASEDVTAQALVPAGLRATALVRAKESGVVAGVAEAAAVFAALDEEVVFEALVADGDEVEPGQVVARVAGPARALLAGERTALNLLQRSSGIATHTARFVAAVRGTAARILCTRKTAPGLRPQDVAAVRAGGGDAHRLSLADRVLVKENHVAAARQAGWARGVADVVARLTAPGGPGVPIGVEVTSLDELHDALAPGVDVVLLDNSSPKSCSRGVAIRDARFPAGDGPELEASGGITLANVRAFAESGVERISVGALTHSARALDLSMQIVLDGPQ